MKVVELKQMGGAVARGEELLREIEGIEAAVPGVETELRQSAEGADLSDDRALIELAKKRALIEGLGVKLAAARRALEGVECELARIVPETARAVQKVLFERAKTVEAEVRQAQQKFARGDLGWLDQVVASSPQVRDAAALDSQFSDSALRLDMVSPLVAGQTLLARAKAVGIAN